MALSASAALWYLPFVLPICLYVAYTDLRDMKIKNEAVLALAGLFLILGLITLPLPEYGMRLLQMLIVLVVGIILNAAGAVGAGDAKFVAAAAPFVPREDGILVLMIFCATLLAAFVTHRIAKYSPLRRATPHWQSWDRGWDFPMGLALGPAFLAYLALAIAQGS
ncbi:prepilin peptidase [Aestuariivita boseongensis]|uniref:prepilin peptidase n=1 Tax=Aestuariivita boseongensis TaxID=1470562 RepID=UPI000681EB16|nr:prepilin peptidase [Aestuariivita boseongensis]